MGRATTRASFDKQLNDLQDRLLEMGGMVDAALEKALRALLERDSQLAAEVIRSDEQINKLRYEIEEKGYLLLATQQPMARDLRRITAAVSIATNMERMADHASGIAILARRLNKERELEPLMDIPHMAEYGREMLSRALDAYVRNDSALAREIAERDEVLNQLYEQVLRELLTYMVEGPQRIRRGTYLLWIAHNLERWGDRIKNICERIVYVATGELADFDVQTIEGALDEFNAPPELNDEPGADDEQA